MSKSKNGLNTKDLLHLLYRVGEPVYYPKGDLGDTCYFEISTNYLPEKYQRRGAQRLLTRFGSGADDDGRTVEIGSLLSDALLRIPLDKVLVVKRRDQFSVFLPRHKKAAGHLISILIGLKTIDDLMAFSAYARDRVNCQLFVYAFSVALLHRQDTSHLRLPSYAEVFPDRFVDTECIADAREQAEVYENADDRVPVDISPTYTGNDSDQEHRLAYFREDLGVNLHHWHWHLVYPFEGPTNIVDKDRRGELFYYMHHQIIARYNVERLCNRLNLVRRLINWDEPIPEAYYPMLNTDVAGKDWPGRAANMRLSDIDRPDAQARFDIDDMKRFRDRIYEAIHRKQVTSADGEDIDINNDKGIDILGHMVEADILTPNAAYYGSIHNMGHIAIAYINDPQYRYNQTTGVMAETSTAMRDPIFYRWHSFIDDIFIDHKNTLSPYNKKTLDFSAVKVSSIEVRSFKTDNKPREDKNTLHTFMMKSDINMSRGLDFVPRGAVLARITHLNHEDYEFKIDVVNKSNKKVRGTVRIFIAPESGFGNYAIDLKEQKELMIEMDRFVVELEPADKVQTITRKSSESSIAIPFEQTFRSLDTGRPNDGDADKAAKFNYCGCGWPEHMLLPKGTQSGYPMVLFVMISNYDEDKVDQENEDDSKGNCRTGVSFCGLKDKKYPDKRPMGFPFDRPVRADTLKSFLTPNMATTSITIVHSPEEREGHLVSRDSKRRDSNERRDASD